MKIEQLNRLDFDAAWNVIQSVSRVTLEPVGQKTALMYTCCNPGEDCIKIAHLLLSRGINPNQRDRNEATALMYAIGNHNIDNAIKLIDLLLENGVDINAVDYAGNTALIRAVLSPQRDIEIIKYLILKGANTDICNYEGDTALSLAREKNYKEAVKVLEKYPQRDYNQ